MQQLFNLIYSRLLLRILNKNQPNHLKMEEDKQQSKLKRIEERFGIYPDFPKPGILFR